MRGRAAHSYICVDCGRPFQRESGDDRRYCADCGTWRTLDAAQQMRLKQGPVYEKAVRGQLARWTAEAQRLGLTTAPND